MNKIELLSPAKDADTGIAAIKSGADAVYIGAKKFGARESAGNNITDIQRLCEFAHQYYARVYVTLNTLLYDHELLDAEKLINRLYKYDVDAVIIQDLGLLELDIPSISFIASTQMNCSSVEKVKFLEKVGFSRVILPRELSLDEINHISKNTDIELEYFVHGALCVGVSGNCYMSYGLGGRSGNRGQCAQPCRKKYTLLDMQNNPVSKNAYLLSLKDLNLSSQMGDLLNAGISSFKIEGRLKNIPYVTNITAYYDDILKKLEEDIRFNRSSSGSVTPGFKPNPLKTFNRGYTKYCVNGKPESCASIFSPKSTGEPMGKVSKLDIESFILESVTDITVSDGICFLNDKNVLSGTQIIKKMDTKIYPERMDGIKIGTEIFRNYDSKFIKLLEKVPSKRRISLTIKISETETGITVEGLDEDQIRAVIKVDLKKELAKNNLEMKKNINKCFGKLGETIFSCQKIDILLDPILFIPLSLLNKIRRDFIEELIKERKIKRLRIHRHFFNQKACTTDYFKKSIDYKDNVMNSRAEAFYRKYGITEIEPSIEKISGKVDLLLMNTQYCILKELEFCNGKRIKNSDMILKDEDGNRFRLVFKCGDCGMDVYFLKD